MSNTSEEKKITVIENVTTRTWTKDLLHRKLYLYHYNILASNNVTILKYVQFLENSIYLNCKAGGKLPKCFL